RRAHYPPQRCCRPGSRRPAAGLLPGPCAEAPSRREATEQLRVRRMQFSYFNFLFVLAFPDDPLRGNHFWPFVDVLQEIRREVTRKIEIFEEPRIARISRMDFGWHLTQMPYNELPIRRAEWSRATVLLWLMS